MRSGDTVAIVAAVLLGADRVRISLSELEHAVERGDNRWQYIPKTQAEAIEEAYALVDAVRAAKNRPASSGNEKWGGVGQDGP